MRAQRYERDLSLAIFDIDNFKKINDAYGHQAGDQALIRFATALAGHSREGNVVARLGGEEFAWLMPETDADEAFTAAERLRQGLESAALDGVGRFTASAGIATAAAAAPPMGCCETPTPPSTRPSAGGRNRTVVASAAPRTNDAVA